MIGRRRAVRWRSSIAPKPFLKQLISDSSKFKELADDNFKFNELDRKFSKWVKTTAEKVEIACYEQFLLFPQRFQMVYFADT